MATSPLSTVAASSLDLSGLSTVTSPYNVSDPRAGSVYDNVTLAGVQPVWFHPFRDGTHLMLARRVWSAATPVGGTPQVYSAYTESVIPSWWKVNGASGQRTAMPNSPTLRTPVTSAVLVAADSRPADLLWVLYSVVINSQPQAVLQMWHIDNNNAVTLAGEEILPSAGGIVFDKGTRYDDKMLHVYGTSSDGTLHRIRKLWNRIGFNKPRDAVATGGPVDGGTWEYYTGSSWSKDPTELAPIQAGVTSVGPVSFGSWRTQTYMSVVLANGSERTGSFWSQNMGRPWVDQGGNVALGSVADGSYLGGGVELQNQVQANSAALATGVNAGIPYCLTRRVGTSGHYSLTVSWAIRPITLVS